MRGRLLDISAISRALGFALVAATIVAAALHFRQSEPHVQSQRAAAAAVADPLSDELKRCQVLATQAKDDAACEAVWAESRRRFFTYPPAPSAPNSPAVLPKSSDR